MRRSLVVGNWKMNGSSAENDELLRALVEQLPALAGVVLAVCPPFVYLPQASAYAKSSELKLGAQDVSVHVKGAYTGETSAAMLVDLACDYVIVGHSERRQYHGESDNLVAQKALAAIQSGLTPIVCVGESLGEREAGSTLEVIGLQLQAVLKLLGKQYLTKVVFAYEPIWAIGTGLTATPEQAQAVHEYIRQQLGDEGESVSILYGGSVKADNAAALFAEADIDGALVGGASLNAEDFIAIAKAI